MRHLVLLSAFVAAVVAGCGQAEFSAVQEKSEQSQAVNANGDPLVGPTDPNKPPGPPISCVNQDPALLEQHRCGSPNGKKSYICHVPEGNPPNRHTLCLPPPAIEAHLREHDASSAADDEDHLGPCRNTLPAPTPVGQNSCVPQQPGPQPAPAPAPVPAPAPDPGGEFGD